MKIEDIAILMGKTKEEVIDILKQNEVIELKLTERKNKQVKDNGKIEIIE